MNQRTEKYGKKHPEIIQREPFVRDSTRILMSPDWVDPSSGGGLGALRCATFIRSTAVVWRITGVKVTRSLLARLVYVLLLCLYAALRFVVDI